MLQYLVYWIIFILNHSRQIWYRYTYLYIYIYKVSYIHSFLLSVFTALHAKHFKIWKNILSNWWVDCLIVRSSKWCDISGYSKWIHFPFYGVFFLCFYACFLWSPSLLLIAESISLVTSGKSTVGFVLNIASPSWFLLSISLNELNSVDWLLKNWRWTFLK